jgi:hypothetical protein
MTLGPFIYIAFSGAVLGSLGLAVRDLGFIVHICNPCLSWNINPNPLPSLPPSPLQLMNYAQANSQIMNGQFPIAQTHNLLPQRCRNWREGRAGGGHFYPQQSRGACSVMEGLCFLSSWVCINGSVFGMLLGAVYINPRSSSRSEAEISQMFSHMQHDVSEALSDSQHTTYDSGWRLQCTIRQFA